MPEDDWTNINVRVHKRVKTEFYSVLHLYQSKYPDTKIEDYIDDMTKKMLVSLQEPRSY